MQNKPEELESNIAEVCRKSAIENKELNLIIAKAEKTILELHGYDASHLDSAGQISIAERNETFTNAYINRMSLSQVELDYLKKKEAERRNNAHTEITPITANAGHKFGQNSHFLPLASNCWTEKAVQRVHNRLWKLDTFNYAAPISVEAYMALAGLTEADIDNCRTTARNGTIHFPPTRGGLDADFPPIASLEKGRCPRKPLLHQKGILKFPADLSELKKLWNAGRPYLKCTCLSCEGNFIWFDHMIWYVIGNLDKVDPHAPSNKIRMLEFQALLQTSWRKPIMVQISFMFMREYMIKIVHLITQNRTITAEEILNYEDFRNVPFVHKFTAAILPGAEGLMAQPANRHSCPDFEGNSLRRCRQMRLGTASVPISSLTPTTPSATNPPLQHAHSGNPTAEPCITAPTSAQPNIIAPSQATHTHATVTPQVHTSTTPTTQQHEPNRTPQPLTTTTTPAANHNTPTAATTHSAQIPHTSNTPILNRNATPVPKIPLVNNTDRTRVYVFATAQLTSNAFATTAAQLGTRHPLTVANAAVRIDTSALHSAQANRNVFNHNSTPHGAIAGPSLTEAERLARRREQLLSIAMNPLPEPKRAKTRRGRKTQRLTVIQEGVQTRRQIRRKIAQYDGQQPDIQDVLMAQQQLQTIVLAQQQKHTLEQACATSSRRLISRPGQSEGNQVWAPHAEQIMQQWTLPGATTVLPSTRQEIAENQDVIQISSSDVNDEERRQPPITIISPSPGTPIRPVSAIDALRMNYGASSAESSLLHTSSENTTDLTESQSSEEFWKRVCRRLNPDYHCSFANITRG
ncbi:hypothetical protein CBR_g48227 [Chara braunii]|uniref:Uncharacterized protein n=1 Tax=Chara braunii TaxID=69332 RepID=A0A388M287_CHABU|nr:hypothetical protein CBR_g48227 [Chara braunii]|eukprot:GBG88698.1 hypothetical protein CBR_g48227 [Chara braunii]